MNNIAGFASVVVVRGAIIAVGHFVEACFAMEAFGRAVWRLVGWRRA
jgi:hypothetical protein